MQASFFGSVLPAVWSFMLAARARGLGSAWTTMHLFHEREAAEVLGIPYDEVTQVALLPLAHVTGEGFKPGPSEPPRDLRPLGLLVAPSSVVPIGRGRRRA